MATSQIWDGSATHLSELSVTLAAGQSGVRGADLFSKLICGGTKESKEPYFSALPKHILKDKKGFIMI